MAMRNSDTDFFGKQEGERILYVIKPHPLSLIIKLAKVCLIAIAVLVTLVVLGLELGLQGIFLPLGLIIFVSILIVGTKVMTDYQNRDIAYITDRRMMRFEPTTLFATNPRSLTWDEVVKVKTYPQNAIWKELAVGNVILHARTPTRQFEQETKGFYTVTADDIELKDVYYYKDLGNYIDEILFTYKKMPKEMTVIKPFVAKPKGQRY